MDELSTEARSLIDAVKQADVPPTGAKEQTWSVIGSRIAEGAAATTAGAAGATTAAHGGGVSLGVAGKILLATVVAGALGWIGLRAATPDPEPTPIAAVQPLAPAELEVPRLEPAPPIVEAEPAPGPALEPAPEQVEPVEPAKRPGKRTRKPSMQDVDPDTLMQETKLLGRAHGLMRGGRYEAALSVLAEHGHEFPGGTLAPEVAAQRVLALCGAGKVDEASKAAKRFLRKYPRNPQASKVKGSCARAP